MGKGSTFPSVHASAAPATPAPTMTTSGPPSPPAESDRHCPLTRSEPFLFSEFDRDLERRRNPKREATIPPKRHWTSSSIIFSWRDRGRGRGRDRPLSLFSPPPPPPPLSLFGIIRCSSSIICRARRIKEERIVRSRRDRGFRNFGGRWIRRASGMEILGWEWTAVSMVGRLLWSDGGLFLGF